MKFSTWCLAPCFFCFLALAPMVLTLASSASDQELVRQPAVAGQFYPENAGKLKRAVETYLRDARPLNVAQPLAIVVPHAGYAFSGQIAADAYRAIQATKYDTVVILGTNHTTTGFHGISVCPRGSFRTPLGSVAVDEGIAGALLVADKECNDRQDVHVREHSLEVQLPFIQHLFPSAKIVPVIVGEPDVRMCQRFGEALASTLRGRRALIVASSDLSHYPAYQDAIRADRQTLEAIVQLNPGALHARIESVMAEGTRQLDTCACGEGAILSAIAAAKSLGATHGVVASYANSGDAMMGDRSRAVGYGAVILAAGSGKSDTAALNRTPPSQEADRPLQASERQYLLALARRVIERYLTTETMPLLRNLPPALERTQGAFVTLKKDGELRGCIGHILSDVSVAQTVGAVALQAAFQDTRFVPVIESELPSLEVEISVLTPMKPVARVEVIVLGRDGVLMKKGANSAVFLPQVAPEQKWNLTEMLRNLCVKAGLSPDSWKNGAQFFAFQADVFSESHK
jgi:MEMO1 family protein